MKIARIHAWGNMDAVKIEEVDEPLPKEKEVLIKVYAAGVNPIDWKVIEGYFSAFMTDCFPFALGWDVCGKITRVGSGVTGFHEGDEVFGLIRFPQPAGTFAEYTTAPVEHLCLKPKKSDYVQAAAVPLVALTAWQALFENAKLSPNQTVLIQAASGAVGQCAVQLAKWKGAKVIAVGSSGSKNMLQSLGADHFIDYKTQKFEECVKEVDCVLDPIGGETAIRSLATLKKGGKMVMLLRHNLPEVTEAAKAKTIDVIPMIVTPNGAQLKEIAHLIDDGLIKTQIAKTFSLLEVKEALNLVKEGHTHGKVVLKVK